MQNSLKWQQHFRLANKIDELMWTGITVRLTLTRDLPILSLLIY